MPQEYLQQKDRKHHYWRGFKAALALVTIILVPVAIALAVFLNHVLAALN